MFYLDKIVYAKVWNIEKSEKYAKCVISTSRKDTKNNTVMYSRWNAKFFGRAFENIDSIKSGDSIELTKTAITNEPFTNKDGQKMYYLNVNVYDFNVNDKNETAAQTTKPDKKSASKSAQKNDNANISDLDEDLPF